MGVKDPCASARIYILYCMQLNILWVIFLSDFFSRSVLVYFWYNLFPTCYTFCESLVLLFLLFLNTHLSPFFSSVCVRLLYDGRTEQKGPRGGTSEEKKTHQKILKTKLTAVAHFFFILNFYDQENFFSLFSETKQNICGRAYELVCVCWTHVIHIHM